MARRTSKPKEELRPPNLMENREAARQKIQSQIEKGQQYRERPINSEKELEKLDAERQKWSEYNLELLRRLFDNQAIADEYNAHIGIGVLFPDLSLQEQTEDFCQSVGACITCLESIRNRLELIPESSHVSSPTSTNLATPSHDVFIVHGHDEGAKQAVARFVEKLGLRAVILHEQPNAGRTIIEKFEGSSDVGFAVVLLTSDDMGYPRDNPEQSAPRARQNVIFELGYFMGKLGRERVAALHEGVELPSDIHGVVRVEMDNGKDWRRELAKEMKVAGLPIDMNDV